MNKTITEQPGVASDKWKEMNALSRNQFKEKVDRAARLFERRFWINMPRMRSGYQLEDLPMSHL